MTAAFVTFGELANGTRSDFGNTRKSISDGIRAFFESQFSLERPAICQKCNCHVFDGKCGCPQDDICPRCNQKIVKFTLERFPEPVAVRCGCR